MNNKESMAKVKGDGGEAVVSEELLAEFKEEIGRLNSETVWGARLAAENTRFCVWDGQSDDGRKHAAANSDEPVAPFEGATDGRVRLADMLVNEAVILAALATMRGQVKVRGVGTEDNAAAAKVTKFLRWVVRRWLGANFVEEVIRLAQYVYGDSPGLGMMSIGWQREMALEMKVINVDELLEMYVLLATEGAGDDELLAAANTAVEDFRAALADEDWGEDMLVDMLLGMFPYLKRPRAVKTVRALRKDGTAEFPAPYIRKDQPEFRAKRFFKDFFVPLNTTSFDRVRVVFEPEWLSRTEVEERALSEGWTKSFKERLLEKEGMPGLKEYERNDDKVIPIQSDRYAGLYQVIRATFRAVNDDSISGWYYVTFSADINEPAHKRRLLDYMHGEFPGRVFRREVLDELMLNSRGIPELVGTHQDMIKLFADSFGDNAQLSGVPPIITRARAGGGNLYIGPLVELPVRRDGDYKWLDPPRFPAQTVNMIKEVRRQVNEYIGRADEDVDPALVEMHREFNVMWWLVNMREVYRHILQLCQQYVPDDVIARVTDSDDQPLLRSREEIQGQYDIEVTFDARDMDPEYLLNLGKTIKDVLLVMDRDKTIDTAPIVATMLYRLAPEMAEESLRDVDRADKSELDDEMENYMKIRAGVEPPMVDDGSQNYGLRFRMYMEMEQKNPDIFKDMPVDKMEILTQRLKHLEMMTQQYSENAQIGRTGAAPALQ